MSSLTARRRPLPFSHLLCHVDGSASTCRAAELSAKLAHAAGARLTFLVVAKELGHMPDADRYREIEGIDRLILSVIPADARACLDAAVTIAYRAGASDVRTQVLTGDVVLAISRSARSLDVDCIVLGRRRCRTPFGWLRRSIVAAVGKRCDRPVLGVP